MARGLFALICPDCGERLDLQDRDEALCRGCQRTFLARLGHLIPVGVHAAPNTPSIRRWDER